MVTLEASQPFRHLRRSELDKLREVTQERTFSAGQDIFQEGDPGDGVYVVKDGEVEISVQATQNAQRVFAQLGPGELFGEMAVLELKPRSATARAACDSVVYFIPRDELLAKLEEWPALALELLREISRRLRDFNQRHIQEMLRTERLAVVGRFARSIVHDLKNPLNIIGLTAELTALERATPEMRQNAATSIRKQVERISDLVTDILDFTQGSRADYVLALTDYGVFVQQVLEELRPEVEPRGVRLDLDGSPPSVRLPLDPRRISRVFYNLIHNAAEAMPGGGRISLRFRSEGDVVVTEIEDTGAGVPLEIAGQLFQAFTTYGKAHGTGLGLSICRKIVEDHHGRIWSQTIPDRGALFAFALPLSGQLPASTHSPAAAKPQ